MSTLCVYDFEKKLDKNDNYAYITISKDKK